MEVKVLSSAVKHWTGLGAYLAVHLQNRRGLVLRGASIVQVDCVDRQDSVCQDIR